LLWPTPPPQSSSRPPQPNPPARARRRRVRRGRRLRVHRHRVHRPCGPVLVPLVRLAVVLTFVFARVAPPLPSSERRQRGGAGPARIRARARRPAGHGFCVRMACCMDRSRMGAVAWAAVAWTAVAWATVAWAAVARAARIPRHSDPRRAPCQRAACVSGIPRAGGIPGSVLVYQPDMLPNRPYQVHIRLIYAYQPDI
jgi:hypothetical protein